MGAALEIATSRQGHDKRTGGRICLTKSNLLK